MVVSSMGHYRPRPRELHLHVLIQLQLAFLVCSLLHSPVGAAYTNNFTAAVPPARCLPDQASVLLRLKRSFSATNSSAIAFRSWMAGTDCCRRWVGVRCSDADGRVTRLDLGNRRLDSGGLDPALFHLTSLRYLNLGWNDFNASQLPRTGFERLTKLTHLNLSNSNFSGQVPHGIGLLTDLVSLDLSSHTQLLETPDIGYSYGTDFGDVPPLKVPNFTALVINLGSLRELHLGSLELHQKTEWCDDLAKYTPNLRVLSLPFCELSTSICPSLSKLRSLSVIDLQFSSLTGSFPNFVANFSFLTFLQLSFNELGGWVSPAIFQHKKLVTADLHYNPISGNLPDFSADSCLQNLLVGRTNFSGPIPSSISNLKSLKKLGLDAPGFSGNLPSSIGKLKSLNLLQVSGLDLEGPIPSWIANLTSLEILQFSGCKSYGQIPSHISSLHKLRTLALRNCNISGKIPPHIFNLTQLDTLVLDSNKFTGTVALNSFFKLPNLFDLNLSNNKLLVTEGEYNYSMAPCPDNIMYISLASCSITKFPTILRHVYGIDGLDLSNNQIHGSVPQWAWEKWADKDLYFLNFSHNNFTSIGYRTFLPFSIEILDLSFNMFEGSLPIPKNHSTMLDYSNNMFSSFPPDISTKLEDTVVFKASRNNLSGSIPPTPFCSNPSLEFLDLSYNILSGSVPACFMENVNPLKVLNLKENQLHGERPQNFTESCTLEVLDMSGNRIQGQLPRSLATCKRLEVLDMGNNEVRDSFPCWLGTLPRLQVLILKHNKFFGLPVSSSAKDNITCGFPSVRILDLSSNNFSGTMSKEWLSELTGMMMVKGSNETLVMKYGGPLSQEYQVTVELTYKGLEITFYKIPRTLGFLDVSNNAFQGSVPAAIGELVLLEVLNMSHNYFRGPIPSQLGLLAQLEFLDMSSNELSGKIPSELASLDSLTTLDLSNNKLVGSIPESPHFSTFSNSSFLGNVGLCGPPLSKKCDNTTTANVASHQSKKKSVDIILFLFAGVGFGVGFAIAIVWGCGIPIRKRQSQKSNKHYSCMYAFGII